MNLTEKRFFRKVHEKLSAPNVFVVYNRWDCVDDPDEETPAERLREQHYEAARSMFVNELGLAEESVADRVFFVSSREALRRRTRTGIRSLSESDEGGSSRATASVQDARLRYDHTSVAG